jgi:hypothetical protein
MTKKELATAQSLHAQGARWYDGPLLFVPVSDGIDMGIGTRDELNALISDGILPQNSSLRAVTPADLV